MPQVICTCTYCSQKTVVINGIEQRGFQVDASTRLSHEKRDKRSASPHRKQEPSSQSSRAKDAKDPNPIERM